MVALVLIYSPFLRRRFRFSPNAKNVSTQSVSSSYQPGKPHAGNGSNVKLNHRHNVQRRLLVAACLTAAALIGCGGGGSADHSEGVVRLDADLAIPVVGSELGTGLATVNQPSMECF